MPLWGQPFVLDVENKDFMVGKTKHNYLHNAEGDLGEHHL